METAIIVAIISGVFTLACTVITVAFGFKKVRAEQYESDQKMLQHQQQVNKDMLDKMESSNQLILYRLDQLEEKQDKHNSVIERTFLVEKRLDVHDEKIKNLERRSTK